MADEIGTEQNLAVVTSIEVRVTMAAAVIFVQDSRNAWCKVLLIGEF
jgi:hypothetical protein